MKPPHVTLAGCLGRKLCPLGPNNCCRYLCSACSSCVDAFILKRLQDKHLPLRLLKELREVVNGTVCPDYGLGDYVLLIWIGRVAMERGYQFGREAVDKAIRESNISEDADWKAESAEIRQAFGVYGRNGAKRRVKRPQDVQNWPCRTNQATECPV